MAKIQKNFRLPEEVIVMLEELTEKMKKDNEFLKDNWNGTAQLEFIIRMAHQEQFKENQ